MGGGSLPADNGCVGTPRSVARPKKGCAAPGARLKLRRAGGDSGVTEDWRRLPALALQQAVNSSPLGHVQLHGTPPNTPPTASHSTYSTSRESAKDRPFVSLGERFGDIKSRAQPTDTRTTTGLRRFCHLKLCSPHLFHPQHHPHLVNNNHGKLALTHCDLHSPPYCMLHADLLS